MTDYKKERIRAAAEELFKTFVAREDTYALQNKQGAYFRMREPLTPAHIVRHLKGEITLAVYVLSADAKAKFTVIDADDDEGFSKLKNAQEHLLFSSYRESSRRGGHLWFFFAEPIEGKLAKNFGLEIANSFAVEAEVFPKQAESAGPGSCIRLPFGIHQKTGKRYPFIGLGNWRKQLDILTDPMTVPLDEVMRNQYHERVLATMRVVYFFDGLGPAPPLWEKVKRSISVRDFVSEFVELDQKGVGKCPFHDDVNPSFSVNDTENYWHCFAGCGGGSVIDFWMKLRDLEFRDAVRELAERLGVK